MMMKPLYIVILLNLILLVQAGCLERTEKITVAPDGRTTMQLTYKGDPNEFENGDAMPGESAGWITTRKSEFDDEGKEEVTLTAKQQFAPTEDLPRSYALPGDDDADVYLDFPTTVDIQQRKDGTYYYFTRTYTPRKWAYIQHWQNTFSDDSIQKLSDKPIEELSRSERIQIVQAMTSVQAFKQIEFAQAALDESAPELDPVHRLRVRLALLNAYQNGQLLYKPKKIGLDLNNKSEDTYVASTHDHTPLDIIVDRCASMEEDQLAACFDEQATLIMKNGYNAIVQTLTQDVGFDAAEVQAFEASYERAKKYHAISERLGGHHFEVCVDLPGTIVAHNANRTDRKKGEACWEVDGDAFRDRPVELQLVTRVQHGRNTD